MAPQRMACYSMRHGADASHLMKMEEVDSCAEKSSLFSHIPSPCFHCDAYDAGKQCTSGALMWATADDLAFMHTLRDACIRPTDGLHGVARPMQGGAHVSRCLPSARGPFQWWLEPQPKESGTHSRRLLVSFSSRNRPHLLHRPKHSLPASIPPANELDTTSTPSAEQSTPANRHINPSRNPTADFHTDAVAEQRNGAVTR